MIHLPQYLSSVLIYCTVLLGYLYHLSKAIVDSMEKPEDGEGYNQELLKKITKPFTNVIIQLDKKVIQKIAEGEYTNQKQETIV